MKAGRGATVSKSAELSSRLLRHLQERTPRLQIGLEPAHRLLVTDRPSLLQVGLELRDRIAQLGDHVVGSRGLLRVALAPLGLLEATDLLLDLANSALQRLDLLARDLAGGVPALGDVAEGTLRGSEVGDRQQRL